MTSLLAWVGVDTHGPASLYLASDSRISWGTQHVWDCGRKVFASQRRPDLFGYVGDVAFPSHVLAQFASLIDSGVALHNLTEAATRAEEVERVLRLSFESLPTIERRDFSVIYATRDSENMSAVFHLFTLAVAKSQWRRSAIPLVTSSGSLQILGSGSAVFSKWQDRWNATRQGRTSRAVFSAFCDALDSHEDPRTGGPAQLVGLYRIGAGRVFGVAGSPPSLFGLPLHKAGAWNAEAVEWRNRVFERCDAHGHVLANAKKHAVPKGLGTDGISRKRSS